MGVPQNGWFRMRKPNVYNGWFRDITILGNLEMFFWSVHHSVTRVLAWFLFRNKSLSRDLSSLQRSLDKNFKCYWYIYIFIPALVWGKCYRNPPILGAKNDGFSIDFSIGIRVSKSWVAACRRAPPSLTVFGWLRLNAAPCWMRRTAPCGSASELRYHCTHKINDFHKKLHFLLSIFCPNFGW